MDRRLVVMLLRLLLSIAAGWLLWRLFFPRSGIQVAAILAAFVLAMAYVSEWWRKKK